MSRIHEALLKAQREHGIQGETLDVENLELKGRENHVAISNGDVAIPIATTARDEAPGSVTAEGEPLSFRQSVWRPDKERLVFMKPEFSRGIEEFRTLRSKLLRERTQRYLKTILITGATPGEGKTFVAANLALAMSRHPGSRVLMIDADLRRSNLHTVFGMEATPGLSGYLSGKLDETAIVRQTPEPQLCVVTAGKYSDSPTELLHSSRMQQFIQNMGRHFDWIFIDSPPATVVADSAVLSEICDGVVLVIAPGTPMTAAQKCRKEIGQKTLGVVLNRAKAHAGYYDYYEHQEKTTKRQAQADAK